MSIMEVAHRYVAAWNRHDADSLVAIFAPGGTYEDPNTGGPLTGPAIGAYASGLWAAFPDVSFEVVSEAPAGDSVVATQWLMRGTNRGSMNGLPPTGKSISLPGADFIEIEGDKVRSVRGYFDSRAVPAQLGLQVVVQPHSVGPFSFGVSTYVPSGKPTRPGAYSITALEVRSEEEVQQVRDYSRKIGPEMLAMEGFLGFVGVGVGRRMLTITAWENAENPRQLMRGGSHKQATGDFFGPAIGAGGVTSVWTPARINPMWVRCLSCDRMISHEKANGRCACGASLPEPPVYW